MQILLEIYTRPLRGFSAALDRGNFVAAAVAAVLVSLPFAGIAPLVVILVVFVPASIAIIAAWDGLGSTGVAVRRDFSPLGICVLLAWTAAQIPIAAVTMVMNGGLGSASILPLAAGLSAATGLYFLVLSVLAIRAISGTSTSHAVVTVIGATTVTIGAMYAYEIFGHLLSFFASPFLLYFLYMAIRPDFSSFTGGLRSGQNFRRNLEACAINPHDSDAQYQLGLIYQARRNYPEAIPRFEKARDIDRAEAGPHYQLGRIAREQRRLQDAKAHLEACAALDDKHSLSDVWRDLGATNLELGNTDLALQQLEKYTTRREYDAEGQYWMGQTYKKLNRAAEARAAFEKAVEAAQTAPPHLRQQTSRWGKMARAELRG